MGIGAWIFNVLFVIFIFIYAYAHANKETLPKDNVEQARWNLLIIFIILPILIAILF